MKIAVVTAIFGGMDTPKPFPEQSIKCDYFCFTEENSPFPLSNLPDRLKAKYFKLQAHRVLPGYDYYVWIDGNIEVKSPDFVKKMVDAAKYGIAIQKHHERETIAEEIDFILKSENIYLTIRYGVQPLQEEYEYYLSNEMSPDAPLYSCNIFAWGNDTDYWGTPSFFDEWWKLVLLWSWFDQSAFSFIAEDRAYSMINVIDLGHMFDSPYFTLHPHNKMQ
jgi:hypothetical protein